MPDPGLDKELLALLREAIVLDGVPEGGHLTPDELERWTRGNVRPGERQRWLTHLAACPGCRAAVAFLLRRGKEREPRIYARLRREGAHLVLDESSVPPVAVRWRGPGQREPIRLEHDFARVRLQVEISEAGIRLRVWDPVARPVSGLFVRMSRNGEEIASERTVGGEVEFPLPPPGRYHIDVLEHLGGLELEIL